MDEFGNIDIEGKNLACSGKDLEKLSTLDGCPLKLVTQRVYNLDDEAISGDEDASFDEDNAACLTKHAKEERMKREYISLVYNSNRDPIKPGTQAKFKRIGTDEEDGDVEEEIIDGTSAIDSWRRINRRYERLGSYEDSLKNESNSFEEISPGRVFKRRLTTGAGPLVSEDTLVIYNCAFWTENCKEPYDSTWLRHNTLITDIANDPILPGLRELILTTRQGEWCEAFIRPEAAFGMLGAMPRIAPNATLFCLLEIVKTITKDKLSLLSNNPARAQEAGVGFQDFYNVSDEARMRGNYFYDQKQYRAALQRYKSGIRILEALTFKDEQEEKKASLLLMKLYNNCARAANASGDPRLALAACKLASEIDDMDPKTHWNRMNAWKIKGHLDRALGVSRRAMQLFPDPKTNKLFFREAEELKRRIQIEKIELDDLHRLMGRAIVG